MNRNADDFTDFLRTQRAINGLSQKLLGQKLGVTQSIIGQWERNEVTPTMKNIKKLSDTLNVPAAEIFTLLLKREREKNV